MSNTNKTIFASPMENVDLDNVDLTGKAIQNPKDDNSQEPGTADQATPEDKGKATSEGEDQTYQKRFVDLKRYHDTKIHELRQKVKQLEQEADSSFTPPKTEEELLAFRQQNPELFDMMRSVAMQNTNNGSEDRLSKLEEELEQAKQREAANEIREAHSDYYSIVSSEDFTNWVEDQSDLVKALVVGNTTNSRDFIRALDLYKLDTGKATADKGTSQSKSNGAQASAADAVLTGGASNSALEVGETDGRIWTAEEISKLKPHEYEMFEEEIDKAWIEGRVR